VDIVVPPPAGTIDVPSCDELRDLMPSRELLRQQRSQLFFWAGRVVPGAHRTSPVYAATRNVREELLAHRNASGLLIVDSRTSAPLKAAQRRARVSKAPGHS